MSAADNVKADLQRFADDLLRLRNEAGVRSFRALEKTAHYSRTTLAKATTGDELPSLDVTLKFVQACGGDLDEWRARWLSLQQSMITMSNIGPSPAAAASPWPLKPVADGIDPDEAGCSPDAITVHARRVALAGRRRIIGQVELRYSRKAHAAWGRFKGYALLDHLANKHEVDIIVEVVRSSDSERTSFTEPYGFDYHWGDLLVTGGQYFFARVSVIVDKAVAAEGETDHIQLE
jgi:hypothetical protein